MNKKDRIAVVVTLATGLFFIAIAIHNGNISGFWTWAVPAFIYWAYRFIKNDISFIKMKDE